MPLRRRYHDQPHEHRDALRLEPLEAREMLSASGLVQPANSGLSLLPIIDLNGPADGTLFSTTQSLVDPVFSLGDADVLVIHTPSTHLVEVYIDLPPGVTVLPVDTSGTSVTGFPNPGQLVLSGIDTPANYETVLKRVRLQADWPSYSTQVVSVFARDLDHREGPLAHRLIEFVDPGNLTLNLGDDSNVPATFVVGGPAVPVPGTAGLSIDSPGASLLESATIAIFSGPGNVSVDTQGTNILAFPQGNHVLLSGQDTVANYEKVLRTAKYMTNDFVPPGAFVGIKFQVVSQFDASPLVHSSLAVVQPRAPGVDLNGPAPGEDFATDFYLGAPSVALVDPELSIDFPSSLWIDGAEISIEGGLGQIAVDTSGTNIGVTVRPDGLQLLGSDSVESYRRVLRSTTISGVNGPPGGTLQVRFKLLNHELGPGPTATSTLIVRYPNLATIDLNGPAPGDGYVGT